MARPLRIEFPGALYHVTSRGNAQDTIFLSDTNRLKFLDQFGQAVKRFDWYSSLLSSFSGGWLYSCLIMTCCSNLFL